MRARLAEVSAQRDAALKRSRALRALADSVLARVKHPDGPAVLVLRQFIHAADFIALQKDVALIAIIGVTNGP